MVCHHFFRRSIKEVGKNYNKARDEKKQWVYKVKLKAFEGPFDLLVYLIENAEMSIYDIHTICEYAKEVLPNIEIAKETCTATKIRQEAIGKIPEDIDLVIIVGDPHSNNTTRLAQIAKDKAHKEVWMIESVRDINVELLKNKQYVAVSSGASTPTYLTNQVIEFLKNYPEQALPEIDYHHILD